MSVFYQFVELFATFVEGLVVLTVSSSMCKKKYAKSKHLLLLLNFTIIYTALITYMNTLQTFSFATIAIAIIYSFVVISVITIGNILLHATSIILTSFFVHALDYTLSYSLIMIMGKSLIISDGIELILSPGLPRVYFLLTDKLLQIIIFLLFKKLYPKLQLLNTKSLGLLFAISTCAYIIMSILTGFIVTDSLLTIQIAVIFSMFFIVVSLIATIATISISAKYQNEKRETELMSLTNIMMEKNFLELESSQNAIHQQVHDFKNHIRTINGMLESDVAAKKYIEDLLSVSYTQTQYCYSNNNVINSIINCKATDAKTQNIHFEHHITLNSPLYLSSADICAILANQIDNALEACEKMSIESDRFVKVEIWQKEAFVFFKVTNTTERNPFNDKHELVSTKSSENGLHGLGIKNILKTVSNYGGTLKNDYINGQFISIAMVPNNE